LPNENLSLTFLLSKILQIYALPFLMLYINNLKIYHYKYKLLFQLKCQE
jgi:hypothetical protein